MQYAYRTVLSERIRWIRIRITIMITWEIGRMYLSLMQISEKENLVFSKRLSHSGRKKFMNIIKSKIQVRVRVQSFWVRRTLDTVFVYNFINIIIVFSLCYLLHNRIVKECTLFFILCFFPTHIFRWIWSNKLHKWRRTRQPTVHVLSFVSFFNNKYTRMLLGFRRW